MRLDRILFACLAAMPLATAARAQDQGTRPIDVRANIGIVSDYRFRGISYSGRDPAVQAGLQATHISGAFVGTWASNVAHNGGWDAELDIYAGYGTTIAGFDLAGTAYVYAYPGTRGSNYAELQGSAGRTFGPVTATMLLAFTPDQKNASANLYTGMQTSIAILSTPFTANLAFGRENGGYDEKLDWMAGLSYSRNWLTVSLSYVDTNYDGANEGGTAARAGLIGSIMANF